MTKQIYMYENKTDKIPGKVNRVGLGNYSLLNIKASFLLFPKVSGNYGSSSWVFLNKNWYSWKMQNWFFSKCLPPIAFSNDSHYS